MRRVHPCQRHHCFSGFELKLGQCVWSEPLRFNNLRRGRAHFADFRQRCRSGPVDDINALRVGINPGVGVAKPILVYALSQHERITEDVINEVLRVSAAAPRRGRQASGA